jgi:hypothetical protein
MKKSFILAAALATVLSACNQGSHEPQNIETCSKLKINVNAGAATRALIEETTLADGSEVAISVLEAGDVSYDGFDTYQNVRFTGTTTGTSQVWTPDADILLSTTMGTLYAYYPYSASVTDIKAVPVQATSAMQTDYMYATPVPNLNNKNATADVELNHALAAVRLSIAKGSFSGTGEITNVWVNGQAIATDAKMNSLTGELSGFSGMDTRVGPAFAQFTLSTTPEVKDFIIIPTGESQPMTITIEIDGFEIEAVTPAVDFAEGTITNYSVTVNSQKLQVTNVSVNPWGTADNGNIDIL